MILIIVRVDCNYCERRLEIEWKDLPDHSDIVSNLRRMGWTSELACPECSKDKGIHSDPSKEEEQ